MRSKWAVGPLATMAALMMLALVAATPAQEDKRPLQPLLQDYYSGTVTVQGAPAPEGTQLVACVDDCGTYQSAAVTIGPGGAFTGMILAPTDRRMIGREVTFHIVNQYGSIQADDSTEFIGVYDLYSTNLIFSGPLPSPAPTPEPTPTPDPTAVPDPTPTAILPVTGDTVVTRIPPLAIVGGAALAVAGLIILYAAARRAGNSNLFRRT